MGVSGAVAEKTKVLETVRIEVPQGRDARTIHAFHRELRQKMAEGHANYRFCMKGMQDLNPILLSVLVCFMKRIRAQYHEANLEIANPSAPVREALKQSDFESRFRIRFVEQ